MKVRRIEYLYKLRREMMGDISGGHIMLENNYSNDLGIEVIEISSERVLLNLPFKETNSNPGGGLHGGVGASLFNACGRILAHEALGADAHPLQTSGMNVNYLSMPIKKGVRAEGRMLRRGKQLCFVGVDIWSEDEKHVATGTLTMRGRFGAPDPAPVLEPAVDDAAIPGPFGEIIRHAPSIRNRGIVMEHFGKSYVRMRMSHQDNNADGSAVGNVHEGAIFALLDTAGSIVSWSAIEPGPYRSSTISLWGEMVGPSASEDLIAHAWVRHLDRETFWNDVHIVAASDGRVMARGSLVYRIVVPETQPMS